MIASLNGPTLLQRRNYLKLIMMYKITRELAETPSMDLIDTAFYHHKSTFTLLSNTLSQNQFILVLVFANNN